VGISKDMGSIKRLGPRYGRTSRHIVGKIEHTQRKSHLCPYCKKVRARRISAGIWFCTKCNAKFTGRAYTVASDQKQSIIKKEVEEEKIDENIIIEDDKQEKGQKYKDNFVPEDKSAVEEESSEESDEKAEEADETAEEETTEEASEAEEEPKEETTEEANEQETEEPEAVDEPQEEPEDKKGD